MSTSSKISSKSNGEIRLSDLQINEEGKVAHIAAGKQATHRLSGMGITMGTTLKVLSRAPFQGPIQIEVRGTKIALGRGLAHKIILNK